MGTILGFSVLPVPTSLSELDYGRHPRLQLGDHGKLHHWRFSPSQWYPMSRYRSLWTKAGFYLSRGTGRKEFAEAFDDRGT